MSDYLTEPPGPLAQYLEARDLAKIPVTLPDGSTIKLSPGGQNELLKQMVDEFCPRFTPNGQVLYSGDAAKKADEVHDAKMLAELGIILPERGKKPDLVVYLADRNWQVLT